MTEPDLSSRLKVYSDPNPDAPVLLGFRGEETWSPGRVDPAVVLPPSDGRGDEPGHDHACGCGGLGERHGIGDAGCFRRMADSPVRAPGHPNMKCAMWDIGERRPITDFSLRQQRGYHQHPCGCWSRISGESANSISA